LVCLLCFAFSPGPESKLCSCIFQEKYQLRLKVLEESLRGSSSSNRSAPEGRCISNGPPRRQSLGGADNISKLTSNGFLSKRTSQSRSLSSSTSSVLKHAKGTSKSFDGGTRSLDRSSKLLLNGAGQNHSFNQPCDGTKETETPNSWKGNSDEKPTEFPPADTEDSVPGILYDMLQKEVVVLRKAGHEKDQSLKDKDDAIEVDIFLSSVLLSCCLYFCLIIFFCNC